MEPSYKLISSWTINSPIIYVILALLYSLLIRLVSSVLKAFEEKPESVKLFFSNSVWPIFIGFNSKKNENNDYWFPYILGALELACYPVLMITGNWAFIGAWLGFKTLAQWNHWQSCRSAFNRFLIGNAFVLIISLLSMIKYIKTV